tara:strand:+ start:5246 stop:6520 length:1275 start_codon:yes stop_codon:yes gene_type:complete
MKLFWQIIYNAVLLPILFLMALAVALFKPKVREALKERQGTRKKVRQFTSTLDRSKLIYWFHCASHGEYDQVRPVLKGLREIQQESIVVVTFYSPPGYNNVDDPNIDLKIYLPLDFIWNTRFMMKLIRPDKLIFAEYDVWPNMVWTARRLNIQTTLFSARLHKRSSKLWPVIRSFYRHVYSSLTTVYTISEKDHVQLQRLLVKRRVGIVRVLGSPRYDQVKELAEAQASSGSILERPLRFIAGSVWPEDDQLILDSIFQIAQERGEFTFTWVPHEPDQKYIEKTYSKFSNAGLSPELFSHIDDRLEMARVVIMDKVGHLSRHYWEGRFAYVGGGFTTGIHNVMEPAIARLPTLFGPRYHNSHAAEELLKTGGGFSINSKDQFFDMINRLISDQQFFLKSSSAATEVIHRNIGSSTRVVRGILRD